MMILDSGLLFGPPCSCWIHDRHQQKTLKDVNCHAVHTSILFGPKQ